MEGILDRFESIIIILPPHIKTGLVTVAAAILFDARCGFVAGFITHAAIVAACLVARRRVVRSEVAIVAIDPVAIARTKRIC